MRLTSEASHRARNIPARNGAHAEASARGFSAWGRGIALIDGQTDPLGHSGQWHLADHPRDRASGSWAARRAHFKSCASPKAYKHLNRGKYVFKVRAVGPGGPDKETVQDQVAGLCRAVALPEEQVSRAGRGRLRSGRHAVVSVGAAARARLPGGASLSVQRMRVDSERDRFSRTSAGSAKSKLPLRPRLDGETIGDRSQTWAPSSS